MTTIEPASWFQVRPVAPATWVISDRGHDAIYLLAGAKRCLLVDTGWGIGDLPALVASLCPLPVDVVNTHGHPDHVYGDGQFPRVHIAEADIPVARAYFTEEQVKSLRESYLQELLPPELAAAGWAPRPPELVPIADGHVFDLGGRKLEVVAVPGHSPGCICLLDRSARLLLTGDSVVAGPPVWLHLKESRPLRVYLASLRRLQDLAGEFDQMLPGHENPPYHGQAPVPKGILDDLADGVESVLAGRAVGQPESALVGDGLRRDFGTCGLIYRADNL